MTELGLCSEENNCPQDPWYLVVEDAGFLVNETLGFNILYDLERLEISWRIGFYPSAIEFMYYVKQFS